MQGMYYDCCFGYWRFHFRLCQGIEQNGARCHETLEAILEFLVENLVVSLNFKDFIVDHSRNFLKDQFDE